MFVELAPPHSLARLYAVLPYLLGTLAIVVDGLYTDDGARLCVVDALQYSVGAVFYQHLVGILGCYRLLVGVHSPLHYTATGFAEIHGQLVAQLHTLLVHVARQIDGTNAVEMTITESVEGSHIALGTVRYRYHVVETALHQCQRIHHALGDDQTVLPDGGIDVPGYQFTVGLNGKVLAGSLILDVDHLSALAIGESQTRAVDAVDGTGGRTHTSLRGRLRLYLPLQQIVDGDAVERS